MTKIHQQTFGKGQSIVLVHGWAMNSRIWLDFAQQLAQNYQVTCIDLPGHGESDKLPAFTLENISHALVDAVSVEKSCWIGWSLGATVVLDLASRFPERVNSLILVAGNPSFTESADWAGVKKEVLEAFADQLTKNTTATLLRFLSLQVKSVPNNKALLKQLKATVMQSNSADEATLQGGLEILKQADLRTTLANTKLPIAVILGAADSLVPDQIASQLLAIAPRLKLDVIEEAGHAPFLSHPEIVLTLISNFMDEQCL